MATTIHEIVSVDASRGVLALRELTEAENRASRAAAGHEKALDRTERELEQLSRAAGGATSSLERVARSAKSSEDAQTRAGRATERHATSFGGLGRAMSGLLPVAGLLGGAFAGMGIAALARGVGQLTGAWNEQVKAQAQVTARLRSTGNEIGLTLAEVQAYAGGIQELTGVGDELLLQQASVLLSFRGLSREAFPDALARVLDLSVAMGTDLNSAVLQVGKALDDPVRGLTALRRSGTAFTADQEKVIKSLVETGQRAEAQRIILDELASQYGGAAAAARQAGIPFDALAAELGDVAEEIGALLAAGGVKDLVEVLISAARWTKTWLGGLRDQRALLAEGRTLMREYGETTGAAAAAQERLARSLERTAQQAAAQTQFQTLKRQLDALVAARDRLISQSGFDLYGTEEGRRYEAAIAAAQEKLVAFVEDLKRAKAEGRLDEFLGRTSSGIEDVGEAASGAAPRLHELAAATERYSAAYRRVLELQERAALPTVDVTSGPLPGGAPTQLELLPIDWPELRAEMLETGVDFWDVWTDESTPALDELRSGLAKAAGVVGDMLREAGQDTAALLIEAASRIASGDVAGGIAGLVAGSGLAGGGLSQFGGREAGNLSAVGSQIGAAFGPQFAFIGAAIGSFIRTGADDAVIILEEAGRDATARILQAEGGLKDLAAQIAATLQGFFRRMEELVGDLDVAAAGLRVEVRGDIITVRVRGLVQGFRSLDEALAWAAEQVLAAQTSVEGLGENLRLLFEGLGGATPTGSFDDLQQAIDLAMRADASLLSDGLRQIIRLREEELDLARRYGLVIADVLALTEQRIAAEQQTLRGLLAQAQGADVAVLSLRNLTQAVDQWNQFLEEERQSRERRLADARQELAETEAAQEALGERTKENREEYFRLAGASESLREEIAALEGSLANLPAAIPAEEINRAVLQARRSVQAGILTTLAELAEQAGKTDLAQRLRIQAERLEMQAKLLSLRVTINLAEAEGVITAARAEAWRNLIREIQPFVNQIGRQAEEIGRQGRGLRDRDRPEEPPPPPDELAPFRAILEAIGRATPVDEMQTWRDMLAELAQMYAAGVIDADQYAQGVAGVNEVLARAADEITSRWRRMVEDTQIGRAGGLVREALADIAAGGDAAEIGQSLRDLLLGQIRDLAAAGDLEGLGDLRRQLNRTFALMGQEFPAELDGMMAALQRAIEAEREAIRERRAAEEAADESARAAAERQRQQAERQRQQAEDDRQRLEAELEREQLRARTRAELTRLVDQGYSASGQAARQANRELAALEAQILAAADSPAELAAGLGILEDAALRAGASLAKALTGEIEDLGINLEAAGIDTQALNRGLWEMQRTSVLATLMLEGTREALENAGLDWAGLVAAVTEATFELPAPMERAEESMRGAARGAEALGDSAQNLIERLRAVDLGLADEVRAFLDEVEAARQEILNRTPTGQMEMFRQGILAVLGVDVSTLSSADLDALVQQLAGNKFLRAEIAHQMGLTFTMFNSTYRQVLGDLGLLADLEAAAAEERQDRINDIYSSLRGEQGGPRGQFEDLIREFDEAREALELLGDSPRRISGLGAILHRRLEQLWDELLAPFETGAGTLQEQLAEINRTFEDLVTLQQQYGGDALRIEAARLRALEEARRAALAPIRAELETLDRARRSPREDRRALLSAFLSASARAQTGDLEAIQEAARLSSELRGFADDLAGGERRGLLNLLAGSLGDIADLASPDERMVELADEQLGVGKLQLEELQRLNAALAPPLPLPPPIVLPPSPVVQVVVTGPGSVAATPLELDFGEMERLLGGQGQLGLLLSEGNANTSAIRRELERVVLRVNE